MHTDELENSVETSTDDVQFVATLPDRYRCPLCKKALKDPLQTACGHRYCKTCLNRVLSGSNRKCPVDGQIVDPFFQDISCQRELSKLVCFCNNRSHGCTWKGKWQNLPEHLVQCAFKEVQCPNPGCTTKVLRQDLKEHLEHGCLYKKIPCQWCRVLITQAEQEEHNKTCPRLPLSCPEGCGEVGIPRNSIADHLQNHCALAQVVCPYKNSGCLFKARRDAVEEHCSEQLKEHVELLAKSLAEYQKKEVLLNQKIEFLTADKQALEVQLDNQREVLAAAVSDMRAIQTRVANVERIVTDHKNELSNLRQQLGSLRDTSTLEQFSAQLEEFRLAIREHEVQLGSLKRAVGTRPSAASGNSSSASAEARMDRHEHQLALHDVNLAEQDIKIQMLEATSYDGMYIWKIDAWPKRLQESKSGRTPSIYSPPFYVGRFGYKVCARAYPNGDGIGKSTHLSMFFVVMKGEYDSLLPWPFHHKVTFRLLDQEGQLDVTDSFRPDPNSSSFKRPTSDMNIASGCPTFISHSTLRTRGYVRDDILFIKITVDTAGIQAH
ncbi:hypothetical protein ACROYT_G035458 [Oculina patagonica]